MPMFRSKRQEARSRRTRWLLALLALLLAVGLLVAWLTLRYYLSSPIAPVESSAPTSTSTPTEELSLQPATSLLILGDQGNEQFLLIQFAPAKNAIFVAPLSNTAALSATLAKNGAAYVKESVATTLSLSLTHHIRLDGKGAEEYMNYLESGLTFTLPEEVRYTDANGAQVHLSPGQRQLTAGQVAALLRHTAWSRKEHAAEVAAGLTAAVFNRYLQPDHRFDGDFAALANVVQTDIRIDHYNAYRTTLTYLAQNNTGGIAQVITPDQLTEGANS